MKFIKILELKRGEAWVAVALPSWADTAPQRLSDVWNHKGLENSLSNLPSFLATYRFIKSEWNWTGEKILEIKWKYTPEN